jgi:hypothetical protein
MPARRFPPPWSAEVTPNCFIVRDANAQALTYIYYESEPGRRSEQRRGKTHRQQYRQAAGSPIGISRSKIRKRQR